MKSMLSDDSSDDENMSYLIPTGILPGIEEGNMKAGSSGSQPGKTGNIKHDIDGALRRLEEDYISDSPKYSDQDFERTFRLPKALFQRISEKPRC